MQEDEITIPKCSGCGRSGIQLAARHGICGEALKPQRPRSGVSQT